MSRSLPDSSTTKLSDFISGYVPSYELNKLNHDTRKRPRRKSFNCDHRAEQMYAYDCSRNICDHILLQLRSRDYNYV